jgi:hypothetical protein
MRIQGRRSILHSLSVATIQLRPLKVPEKRAKWSAKARKAAKIIRLSR